MCVWEGLLLLLLLFSFFVIVVAAVVVALLLATTERSYVVVVVALTAKRKMKKQIFFVDFHARQTGAEQPPPSPNPAIYICMCVCAFHFQISYITDYCPSLWHGPCALLCPALLCPDCYIVLVDNVNQSKTLSKWPPFNFLRYIKLCTTTRWEWELLRGHLLEGKCSSFSLNFSIVCSYASPSY